MLFTEKLMLQHINDKEPVYWSNLALAYRDAGNRKEAEKAMVKAVSLDSTEIYAPRLKEIRDLMNEKV